MGKVGMTAAELRKRFCVADFTHKDTRKSLTQPPPKVNRLASTSHSSPPRSYRENCPEANRGRNAFTFLNKGLRPPLAK